MPRQIVWLLVDGLGDYCTPDHPSLLGGCPQMARLARTGLNGLLDPVQAGLACGSDTAHMSLFGYNPFEHYAGRGAFEAMGAGLQLSQTDIGFKCNFAHLEDGVVLKRRVDRNFPSWGIPLVQYLNGHSIKGFPNHCYEFKYAN